MTAISTDTANRGRIDLAGTWAWTWPPGLLLLVYVLAAVIAGPSGDFPLGDDWAYASTLQDFVRTGIFRPSDWTTATLFGQILLTAPVCALSSCGPDALRLTTLGAALVLTAGVYLLVGRASRSPTLATLAAAVVAFNPITFALAFSFMTDIYFTMLAVLSAALFLRALEQDDTAAVVLATALALAATLTRQFGIALPLGFAAAGLLRATRGEARLPRALIAVLPLAVCAAGLVLYGQWLESTGRLPAESDAKSELIAQTLSSPVETAKRLAHNLSTILLYTGLSTLPLLLATRADQPSAPRTAAWIRWAPRALAAGLTLLAAADLLALHRLMPSGGNTLIRQGLGPMLLPGAITPPQLPEPFWLAVTALALWGAFLLASRVAGLFCELGVALRRGERPPATSACVFATVTAFACLAPTLLFPFFDRYLLAPLPFVVCLLALSATPAPGGSWRMRGAVILTASLALFAVTAQHDLMAWNRARWAALTELERQGVSAAQIDGGFEYNGLRAYRPDYVATPGKSWWWVADDQYIVTFGPVRGYRQLSAYPYRTWSPPARRTILVLERETLR
ncbi:glycosyltransferase family 39 protein [Phenylobacterium sp. LjRoot219]|uniref:glycosyltransferase family 39 protein n=1 Tax=Phenylobacterium sp. LjRoot219 TaxID=3342283 RepID=UPI003ECF54C7